MRRVRPRAGITSDSVGSALPVSILDDGIGQPLSPWTVSADFRRAVHELGLPRTRFHDLRHAHATQLLWAGVHVKAVSERLGHASTSFTMDTYSAVILSMAGQRPTRPISCSGIADGKLTATTPSSDCPRTEFALVDRVPIQVVPPAVSGFTT